MVTTRESVTPHQPGGERADMDLKNEAIKYATHGWRVLPCRDKVPDMKQWTREATTDRERIRDMFQQGGRNIGILTGPRSGLIVVDVDTHRGGSTDGLPPTLIAHTPNGGCHYYYRYPQGRVIASRTNIRPGIDIRADGGQVIAPPSSVDGVHYVWDDPREDPREAPGWVLELAERSQSHQSRPEKRVRSRRVGDCLNEIPRDTTRYGQGGTTRYGQAALDSECKQLRQAPEGSRNDTLNRAAFYTGQLMANGEVTHEDGTNELSRAAQEAGLGEDETETTLQSGFQAGYEAPRENSGSRYFGSGRDPLKAATLATDIMAEGPVAFGKDGQWWGYSDGVWQPEPRVIRNRTAYLLGEHYRHKHASAAEGVVMSRADTITCEPVPDYINFGNGLANWRTGTLHQHDPSLHTTVQLPVEYDDTAVCPGFNKFLSEVVPSDMIETMWELIGYLMYSGNPLHKAVMLTGTGRNGKGVFLHVVGALLGTANTTSVSLHEVAHTRFSTASLFGKLANLAGDIDGKYMESTALFKAITGGDTINSEHKGRDRFDFRPWATPVFSANKIPPSADTTPGYFSRWLVLPFPCSFQGVEDRGLEDRLTTASELQGIAATAMQYLPQLFNRGDFPTTQSGREALGEFEKRVDQVRTWLDECTETDPHGWIPRTELYGHYKRWAIRDGHKALKASEFYDRLESCGHSGTIRKGTRGYPYLAVTDAGGEVL